MILFIKKFKIENRVKNHITYFLLYTYFHSFRNENLNSSLYIVSKVRSIVANRATADELYKINDLIKDYQPKKG